MAMVGDFTPEELEGTAEATYRRAGLDPGEAADLVELAERLLGAGAVRAVHGGALPGAAALARVGSSWCVFVRARLPEQRVLFAVGHELGHHVLGADAPEWACDAFAGALLAPRQAYLRAAREIGPNWSALAERFHCSESWSALRWGEVIGTPTALIAPLSVRVRGEPYAWPERPSELRALALAPRPGLARARLRDDPHRIIMRCSGE
jgi:hypothetical protein